MKIKLSARARAHARRAGVPWFEDSSLKLAAGPHLFLDWRFVLPGEPGLIGPYWGEAEGRPIPLRLWNKDEWKDRPVHARYIPQDIPQGIRIVAQQAGKEQPFRAGGPPGTRILYDEGMYRTWYKAPEGADTDGLHCAESNDGYSWERETDCVVDWSACKQAQGSERPEVFVDPVAPPHERFKMFFRAGLPAQEAESIVEEFQRQRPDAFVPTVGESMQHLAGMYGCVSPDGIHWKAIPGPLVVHYSDTTNVVYYDQQLRRYVWYARCNWYYGRRCIGRAETDDFHRWPAPEMLVWPTTDQHPADDWYTNSKTLYPGTTDHHLMFPALFHHADDTSDLRLFSSPDGLIWSAVPGGPVLETGMPGSWDGGCVFGGLDLIPLSGQRVALPYSGYLYPHKYPRNRLTFKSQTAYALWPQGRLSALEAVEEGRFTTLPLLFEGRKLHLNVQTKHAGYVQVEVADRTGRPLPGRSFAEADPISGDHLDRAVTWKGEADIERKPEQSVLLRFRLRAAGLFAFEFTD